MRSMMPGHDCCSRRTTGKSPSKRKRRISNGDFLSLRNDGQAPQKRLWSGAALAEDGKRAPGRGSVPGAPMRIRHDAAQAAAHRRSLLRRSAVAIRSRSPMQDSTWLAKARAGRGVEAVLFGHGRSRSEQIAWLQ
ncbi:MAG: hypothetical protein IH606_17645 [Burkholderiales bacterium]|nr:hypothetical protein [Burkholderiales bacterium]